MLYIGSTVFENEKNTNFNYWPQEGRKDSGFALSLPMDGPEVA